MGASVNDDLLSLLMESNFKVFCEDENSKNAGMTIDEVIEECKLFYFAGQEMTSVLLTWTMIALSMDPSWQVRAREEVLQVFGKNKPNFDGLNQLKIVTMILYEVLRLYPPAITLLPRVCQRTKLGETSLPPGVDLIMPLLLVHRDAKYWGKDANEFNPERFSGGVSKASNNSGAFFPFGWGPRICIGQSFAMIEAKMPGVTVVTRNWYDLSTNNQHPSELNNVAGKMFVTWIGTTPRVSITDPELIREILSNKSDDFEKPKSRPIAEYFISGLVNYQGKKWAKHRRIINPAFHLEKLKRMLPAFSTCCSEMISRWDGMISVEGSRELDVWPELQNLTGDVISRTAFGSSFEEGRQIFQLQLEQAELLIRAFQSISVYVPGFRFLPTKDNIRMKEIYKTVRTLLRGIIEKREKAINMGASVNDDLLSLLMESNFKVFCEDENSKNAGMTIDEVIEECKLFYFAGQETTSVLLTWTMIALSMDPSWQVRAREEVLQVFGKNKPNFDGLNQLKIVTMILYEVLRLYPPATALVRRVRQRTKLGETSLPPEVDLIMPFLLVHRDAKYWGKDANEFNPERFSGGVSKASNNSGAFFPFGWGPRICIGQSFAMIEAKMALAMILQHFSFELSPSYAHAPYTVITLQPQHGAQIILHKI
ncbi:hypothetical protein HHK36_001821 [Tetracentron sinense]|uniref:Cytochrome P450 n=1 Tax=Tetracentron sinense TaxID=13715 RepID=A0A835A4E5_TETSI|nr:hypothetical protein HHK36_001821 [Tetracentron sinense]